MGADPLNELQLPDGLAVRPYSGEREELEALLASAFDEGILPVISHNIESPDRNIWVMVHNGKLVAAATLIDEGADLWVTAFGVDPKQQGKGYGKAFLLWCRHHAFAVGKHQILLDVETENDALQVYEKSGFRAVDTVAYWKKASEPA